MKRRFVPTAELKRKLADLPALDSAAMRAEMDALFGEERVGDDLARSQDEGTIEDLAAEVTGDPDGP